MTFSVVLDCITDEILQGSLQCCFVAFDRRQVWLDHRLEIEIRLGDLSLTSSHGALDKVWDVSRAKLITLLSRLRARKLQHLLNHFRQTTAFPVDDVAVLRNFLRVINDSIGEVFTCRTDYCERRAQLVGYPGHEIDLLAGQTFRAPCRNGGHKNTGRHQQKNAKANREVTGADTADGGRQRASVMFNQ